MRKLATMALHFHHFFVFAPPGAAQADTLIGAGFIEGSRNTHPGQGTANRRFFFKNGMLEFLWIHDVDEISSELTKPTRLAERSRWRESGFSPFGIGLYGTSMSSPPFPGWAYAPSYLPENLHIWVADNAAHPEEPMLFYGSFFPVPEQQSTEPVKHDNDVERITGVTVYGVSAQRSAALSVCSTVELLAFCESDHPLTVIEFDSKRQGQEIELESLPILIRF